VTRVRRDEARAVFTLDIAGLVKASFDGGANAFAA
jgi:hypothetical protein